MGDTGPSVGYPLKTIIYAMREKNETKRERPILLRFFVTEKEKEKILKKAKGSQNLSDYLRKIALNGKVIHPAPALDRVTFTELNRIGNNLNQIARHLNSAEANIFHKSTKKELLAEFKKLSEKLDLSIVKIDEKIKR